LKYFTYRLVLVLDPNYKQHILLQAEVRHVCYSIADLYVKSVYLNLFRLRGGTTFMKHFKGGAISKMLGTSGLDTDISAWKFVVPVIYVHCEIQLLK
jgi:hypothetical protein